MWRQDLLLSSFIHLSHCSYKFLTYTAHIEDSQQFSIKNAIKILKEVEKLNNSRLLAYPIFSPRRADIWDVVNGWS